MSTATRQRESRKAQQQGPPQQRDNDRLLEEVIESTLERMDQLAEQTHARIEGKEIGKLQKAAVMGQTILRLREMFTPELIQIIRGLSGSSLGFLCDRPNDRNKEPYSNDVLRDCCIEAVLRGFAWVGNEFNIIGGRMMGVQAGWRRKCEEIPGLTDLKVIPGKIVAGSGQTAVQIMASWKLNGTQHELTGSDGNPGRFFAIPQNAGSTADNNYGKALRRAYKALFEEVTGTIQTEPDGDLEEAGAPGAVGAQAGAPSGSRADELADRMGAAPGAPGAGGKAKSLAPAWMEREAGVEGE